MRALYFTQITDDRFNNNIYNLLQKRVLNLKQLLNIQGLKVSNSEIYKVEFDTNKQYRCDFMITKTTNKITWNDIYKIVNSINAVPYRFKSY